MSHAFNLNAQRRRWCEAFDAVAGAMLVIAPDRGPTSKEQAEIVAAAMFGSPDVNVHAVTDLVLSIAGAIDADERDRLIGMIEHGKPRSPATVWATVGMMVEIVRRVRGLDEDTVDLVIATIPHIGEHPLMMLGFPS